MLAAALIESSFTATLSERSDPDHNGVILRGFAIIEGQSVPRARITLDVDGDGRVDQTARGNSSGRFQMTVPLTMGNHELTLQSRPGNIRSVTPTASTTLHVTRGDLVLNWNDTLLETVRATKANPPLTARNLAMIHVAMHDAVASRENWSPLVVSPVPPPPGSYSALAAATQAAYSAALTAFPSESARFEATLREGLGFLRSIGLSAQGITAGREFGQRVANSILAARANDGSKAVVNYVPSNQPGEWRPTPPAFAPALLPQWPVVKPIAVSNITTFRPLGPPELDSSTYADDLEQVRLLGSANNSTRTADQTSIALFWADGAGTITPPGHWNQIAADVALQERDNAFQNIRVFAALNMALCDAAIAAWDAKYTYNLWRPITAVREADKDGNSATTADPTWTPLLVTPPFSAYVSGHSSFSGAAESVLGAFFGSNTAFVVRPDPSVKLGSRSFDSFHQAAEEAGISRIYGGIHYAHDNTDGLALGRSLGQTIIDTLFQTRRR